MSVHIMPNGEEFIPGLDDEFPESRPDEICEGCKNHIDECTCCECGDTSGEEHDCDGIEHGMS